MQSTSRQLLRGFTQSRIITAPTTGVLRCVPLCSVKTQQDTMVLGRRGLLALPIVMALPFGYMFRHAQGADAPSGTRTAATGTWRLMPTFTTSHEGLVNKLRNEGLVHSQRVSDALMAVDRSFYVNSDYSSEVEAYQDHPLRIGHGQTISAPHMHAICLSMLEQQLQPGANALDVGSGSGYLTAAMAHMVGETGHVLGVEQVPELVEDAWSNVARGNPELLLADAAAEAQTAAAAEGAGGAGQAQQQQRRAPPRFDMRVLNVLAPDAQEILAPLAPFDAIHVGAAAASLPQGLVDLLKPGGRMVIPVGAMDEPQVLMQVDKDASGHVTTREVMGVGYVPLTPPGRERKGYVLW